MIKKLLFKKIIPVFIFIMLATVAFFAYLYFALDMINTDRALKFGATFTKSRAEELDLNWKETYLAVLDDLGAPRLRLGAYWNDIEEEKGKYNFDDLDWMVGEAEKRDVEIILAMGMRLPGWPECHIPDWARESLFSDSPFARLQSEKSLLQYIRMTIERYRDSSAILAWQVENEPFLRFGECPRVDKEFLNNEIKLVKTIDKRPVIITDSGEFGTWRRAAPLGDIFGTTLYRSVYHHRLGYIKYPLPPIFYRLKSLLIRKWIDPKDIIVMELQAEPWVADPPISDAPLEEQYITMSPDKFKDLLDYIRYTDFNEFYFWGVEWWYWMKLNRHNEIWSMARDLFIR